MAMNHAKRLLPVNHTTKTIHHHHHHAMYCIRYIQSSDIFRTIFIHEYLGIFKHIQHPVNTLHIHSLAIFGALAYLEPEANSKPCKTLIQHTQNPAIVRTVYSSIIQPFSGLFRTLCDACICRNLEYPKS